MPDAYELLQQYIALHRSGAEADPRDWLERVEGPDRAKLAGLIDAYLARAPMRAWDPEAFGRSGLADFAERVNDTLYSESGTWPVVLPSLRAKARLKRSDLVERLAAALGAQDKQAKVGSYYHEMESGDLPSEGVNDKVLEALGSILGQSAEGLRRAGRAIGSAATPAGEPGAAFARTAQQRVESMEMPAPVSPGQTAEPDEVDRLFRGG